MFRFPTPILACFLCAVVMSGGPASAGDVGYVQGELIVKFKSEGDHALQECAEDVLAEGRSFRTATADGSDSLDRLRQRLGIHRARALFRRSDGRALGEQRRRLRQRFERASERRGRRARLASVSTAPAGLAHVYLIELSRGVGVERAVSLLEGDPHVEYAQPNFAIESDAVPNDPYFASRGSWGQDFEDLWGLHRIGAEQAWDLSKGEGVVVAVVDTGLDYDHPDIADNVWINPGEDLNGNGVFDESDRNGVDDDGNGYTDDIRGFDFFSSIDANQDGDFDDPEDVSDSDPFDDLGHGTHVAGTVAAVGDNGMGIIGVAPEARIMPLKVFGVGGSSTVAMTAQAMLYAVENGADVINNSWSCSGGRCPENPVTEEVVKLAYQEGLVIVTSAGNLADDVSFYSPEKLRETITVGASDRNDERASFSNFGLLMDVLAPGGGPGVPPPSYLPRRNILSLLSSETAEDIDNAGALRVGDDYLRLSGTSMSAPHVAGLAALILARHPEFTNDDVRRVLRLSADDLGAPGHDRNTGAGRINAAKAVAWDSLPRMNVEITSPRQGGTVNPRAGFVEIEGTVSGPDLLEYSLSFGRGFEPEEWFPIGPERAGPVRQGLIARWCIDELEEGLHVVRLVATARDGTRFEEYLFLNLERNSPVAISSPGTGAALPAISGELVVWQADTTSSNGDQLPSLFLADLRDGGEFEIASGLRDRQRASISGTDLAWLLEEGDVIYTCRFDRGSGTCPPRPVKTAGLWATAPDVSDGRIVWSELRDGEHRLMLCELDEAAEVCPVQEITPGPEGIIGIPQIDDLRLLWQSALPFPGGLHTCEWNPATRECPQWRVFEEDAFRYDFFLADDLIAWEEYHDWSIPLLVCELDSKARECSTTTVVSVPLDFDYVEYKPAVSGRRVVWNAGSGGGNVDIYFCEYDRVARKCPIQRLTGHAADQRNPAIDGDWIVFEDNRRGWSQIAGFELPSLDPIGDRVVAEGGSLRIPIVARDPAGGHLELDARLMDGEALETIGADFKTWGPGRGELRWSPGYDRAGRYAVTFTATTRGRLQTGETIWIEVLDVDEPPVAIAGRSRLAFARSWLNGCRSFDPEGQPLSYIWRDGSGRELGETCRLSLTGSSVPRLESYTLTVSDGTHSDADQVWVLWVPRSARPALRWWWRLVSR